jgi:hypothetical protein
MSRSSENDGGDHRFVSIRVGATPLRAFEAFTEEIGDWWRPNPLFALTPRGDGHLRFEPGEGGRLVATLANGKEFEVGRITVWKPGERLAVRRHSPPASRRSLTCASKRWGT